MLSLAVFWQTKGRLSQAEMRLFTKHIIEYYRPFMHTRIRILTRTLLGIAIMCLCPGTYGEAWNEMSGGKPHMENEIADHVQYTETDSLKVASLLSEARRQSDKTNITIFFARKLIGLPYVAHTLEVNKREKLVVNLRQLDCTTYVENVVALTMCVKQNRYSFAAFCDNLRTIRYRGGSAPHYVRRLHYFTDWIQDNTAKGICREIQSPNPPFSATQKIKVYYMSTYPEKYEMLRNNPEHVKPISATENAINGKSFRYIPKAAIKNTTLLRNTIKDGDIIALTTTLKGLDIQHVGFAVWHKDGLHLLNASSLRHKVVEEPQTLYAYLQKQRTMTGVRVVRFSTM